MARVVGEFDEFSAERERILIIVTTCSLFLSWLGQGESFRRTREESLPEHTEGPHSGGRACESG